MSTSTPNARMEEDERASTTTSSSIESGVVSSLNLNNLLEGMEFLDGVSHFEDSYRILNFRNIHRYKSYDEFVFLFRKKLLSQIIMRYKQKYDKIQVRVKILNSKVSVKEKGPEIEYCDFWILSKVQLLDSNALKLLVGKLLQNFQSNHEAKCEGSGWSFLNIKEVEVHLFTRERHVKTFGAWCDWPEKVKGKGSIINIRTSTNCVEMCILAHKLEKMGYLDLIRDKSNPEEYVQCARRNNVNINFPKFFDEKNESRPVTMEDFTKIENHTETCVNIYQLKETCIKRVESDGESSVNNDGEKRVFSLKTLRLGKTNVVSEQVVSLLQIGEADHVVLITDFEKFCRAIRKGHYKIDNTKKFCPSCIAQVKINKFEKHVKICSELTTVHELIMPKKGEKYKFKSQSATELCPYTAYYDTEASLEPVNQPGNPNILNKHVIMSYYYIIVNKKGEIVKQYMDTGKPNLPKEMVERIWNDFRSLMDSEAEQWERRAILSDKEESLFLKAKHCMFCNVDLVRGGDVMQSNTAVRHHRWDSQVEYGYENGRRIVTKGNYIGAACNSCNLKISTKKATLPIFAHNAGRYDHKFLLEGLNMNFPQVNILSKDGETLLQLEVCGKREASKLDYKMAFRDSLNFLSGSLDNLAKSLKNSKHKFRILEQGLKSVGYSETCIGLATQKGFFPYEHVTSVEVLQENVFPPKSAFYSSLTDCHITQEDYEIAKKLYETAGCKNLGAYMELYLRIDVLLLAEIFENFRSTIFKNYKLDPSSFITTPSLAIQSALFHSNLEIGLLTDMEVYTEFENSIRGGLTSVVRSYTDFNSKYLDNYDKLKPISSGAFLDVNSLYPTVMSEKLPYGNFKELNDVEIEKFKKEYKEIDLDGPYCYAVSIDYDIPDNVKMDTDDLPLSIHKKTVSENDVSPYTANITKDMRYKLPKQETLLADHSSQSEYLISLKRLRLLLDLGINVTKIHRVFRFDQDYIFKDFIEKNIKLRNEATSDFEKLLFKLFSNALYGKTLYNARKNNMSTTLVRSKKRFEEVMQNPLLHSCFPIAQDMLIMRFKKSEIKLNHPMYMGWFILENSKWFMYKYFYQTLKATYGADISLLYMDTDSFMLKLDGREIFDEFAKEPLRHSIDRSNFPRDEELFDDSFKGKLGYWKSETQLIGIREFVALQCKLYSVLLNTGTCKSVAKGVTNGLQQELSHGLYKKVYSGENLEQKSSYCRILSSKYNLYTIKTVKRSLSKVEKKRWWRDMNTSYAYGHPLIPSLLLTCTPNRKVANSVKRLKRNVTGVNFNQRNVCELSFNHRRLKPTRGMFNRK